MAERQQDKRESGEPPEGTQNRERESPPDEADDDAKVDKEAEDTFPASDPPAHY